MRRQLCQFDGAPRSPLARLPGARSAPCPWEAPVPGPTVAAPSGAARSPNWRRTVRCDAPRRRLPCPWRFRLRPQKRQSRQASWWIQAQRPHPPHPPPQLPPPPQPRLRGGAASAEPAGDGTWATAEGTQDRTPGPQRAHAVRATGRRWGETALAGRSLLGQSQALLPPSRASPRRSPGRQRGAAEQFRSPDWPQRQRWSGAADRSSGEDEATHPGQPSRQPESRKLCLRPRRR